LKQLVESFKIPAVSKEIGMIPTYEA
jgi:hypothetical protein